MMRLSFLFILIFFSINLYANDLEIPREEEEKIYSVLLKFEGKGDLKKVQKEILEFNHEHVEAVIFKYIEEIDKRTKKAIGPILRVLGHFNTHRAILTIAKYAEPFERTGQNITEIPRSRHIRVSAIYSLMMKPTEDRAKHLIRHISDNDAIFQSNILRLLTENKIANAIEPAYEIFKNSNTEDKFIVRIDAANLIMALCNDPFIKNAVLKNMLNDPNLHIRKAALTLVPDGGLIGDIDVRELVLKILKNSKTEELELACKATGKLRITTAKDELIRIQEEIKVPMIQWEALFSLYLIKMPPADVIKLIELKSAENKSSKKIKSADEERFDRLIQYINEKEGKK